MLIKDEIPFFLHSYQIVDPLLFSISLIPSGDVGAVLGIKTYNGWQDQRGQEKFLHWG